MFLQPQPASSAPQAKPTAQPPSSRTQNARPASNDLLADLTGPSPSSTPASAPVSVGKASAAPPSFTTSTSTQAGGELFDLVTPQPGSSSSVPQAKQPMQAPGSSKADILALFSSPAPVQQRPQSQTFNNFSAAPPQAQAQHGQAQMNALGGGFAGMNLSNARAPTPQQAQADPWGSFGQETFPSQSQQSMSAQPSQQQSGFGSFTSSAPANSSSSAFSDLFSSQDVWSSGPSNSSSKSSNANHDIWGDFK